MGQDDKLTNLSNINKSFKYGSPRDIKNPKAVSCNGNYFQMKFRWCRKAASFYFNTGQFVLFLSLGEQLVDVHLLIFNFKF